VNLSNAIHDVGADHAEIGHSDFLGPLLFDDGHRVHFGEIIEVLGRNLLEEDVIDQVDDLKMSRE
jgi:hypothetical protein